MSQSDPTPKLFTETPVRVRIASNLLDSLLRSARDAAPMEVGWVLFGMLVHDEPHVHSVRALRNAAPNPREHFHADPVELINVSCEEFRNGRQCVGNAHSHPRGTARMSREDRQSGPPGGVLMILATEPPDGVPVRAYWFEELARTGCWPTASREIEVAVRTPT